MFLDLLEDLLDLFLFIQKKKLIKKYTKKLLKIFLKNLDLKLKDITLKMILIF